MNEELQRLIAGQPFDAAVTYDPEFWAELAFADLVRDLVRSPLDFLMITGELFLSYKGPGSDLEILDLVKTLTPTPASTVLTAVVRGCRAFGCGRLNDGSQAVSAVQTPM